MGTRTELTKYQTSNSKTYLNKDGTISIEIYDEPIGNSGIMLANTTEAITGGTIGVNTPLNIIDTYISSTGATTGNEDKIKVGVERINGSDIIHRALLKFDLPSITSSYALVSATLNMIGYYDENYSKDNLNTMVSIHQLKKEWTETNATWSNMNDEFNPNIENYFYTTRSGGTISDGIITLDSEISQVDVTDLVQRWYNNEPNYGLMLKAVNEIYDQNTKIGEYYTKNAANDSSNPQPRLVLKFKNLNGLESYLTYTSQSHELGSSHINNCNGNLTALFNVANTVGGPLPASIDLIYNTADMLNNNDYGYGLGIKPNLIQTIKEVSIDSLNVLEYLDEDGTIHYFYKNNEDNCFYDEDGLALKVELVNDCFIMSDKNKNTNKFVNHNGTYYLEQITDITNKSITIEYDLNNKITKVIDASTKEITISYEENKIIFLSPYKSTIVNLTNNQITSIEDLGDVTTIIYNDNKLIEKIINSNGLYTKYEYTNNLTNKVSKVTEYSRNGNEGNYLEFTYNLKSTSIKDRKGHINTYVFNNNANTETISSLDETQNLSNAYGKSSIYGDIGTASVNRITLDGSLVRHINNLIDDSSFESGSVLFTSSNEEIITDVIGDTQYGVKALKVENTTLESYIYLDKKLEKNNYYTFSAYIKNEVPYEISLSYDNVIKTTTIYETNSEYSRTSVVINYSSTAISDLRISIKPLALGVIYLDGIQLEEGEVANYYNMISNSNFNNELTGYEIVSKKRTAVQNATEITTLENPSVEIKSIDDSTKALRLINSPLIETTILKSFFMSGKAGDVFELSFWYKNEGPSIVENEENELDIANIMANLHFEYVEGENDKVSKDQYLTQYNKDWHYFSKKFVAKYDYTEVVLNIKNQFSCRDCYITNLSLFKDLESYSYTYDDAGNLVCNSDLSRETSTFNYNGENQLMEAVSPSGNKFKYEYDENVTDRLIRAISPSGITNSIDYDDNNNPIKIVINNTEAFNEIINTTYYIRAKGTDSYFYIKPDKNLMVRKCECSHDKFNVIIQEDNRIKLQYSILNNYYLKNNGGILKLEYGDIGNNTFELIENTNKLYSIISAGTSLAITLNDDNTLSLNTYNETNDNQQFIFERMESKLFIESSAIYNEDNRFINKVKDSLGNETIYNINNTNGTIAQTKDAKNNYINYEYDDKLRISKINTSKNSVSYEYNRDLLSKIVFGNDQYIFEYDEFNNSKKINLNNINLEEKFYENNNGNLIKVKYGNGSEINYTYDEYNRVKNIIKSDNVYNNYYDNLSRIAKIISDKENYKYEYDFAKRISKYKTDGYETTFNYGQENNVETKKESLNNKSYMYQYTYNNESIITNIKHEGDNFNYKYDKLGRLYESTINNFNTVKYYYITNGNKTSTKINKVDDNGTIYSYKYDALGNLIELKKDNSTINNYYYDESSQLIKHEDLLNKEYTDFTYDNYGNLLRCKKYNSETNAIIAEDVYLYDNVNWQNQLTKFNNDSITYDELGNILSIGNKQFTWKNGRELETYNDASYDISYNYNMDSTRIEKIVNGVATKFYLEGTKIIFEDRNGIMIYYIYNGDELLGFKYNDITYYYHKNIFGDIIGILDSNNNELVTYEYDSWGSITKINDYSNINLGKINPFRYRSYYYDEETDLYYLTNRYYSPKLKRFISPDSIISGIGINSNNLYVYCNNMPIITKDKHGNIVISALVTAIVVGAVVGAATSGISHAVTNVINDRPAQDGLGKAMLIGGITGGLGGAITYLFTPFVTAGIISDMGLKFTTNLVTNSLSNSLSYGMGLSDDEEAIKNLLLLVPMSIIGAKIDMKLDKIYGANDVTKTVASIDVNAALGIITGDYSDAKRNYQNKKNKSTNKVCYYNKSTYTLSPRKSVVKITPINKSIFKLKDSTTKGATCSVKIVNYCPFSFK